MGRERYRNFVWDSARWDAFTFREGDIVISTPPKCGTTWTQTICALLIFGSPDFPAAMDQISPWLDMQLRPIDEVIAQLDAQTHRRFIKTHTPLDGIPWDERVTYITVGRDPRDVALSADHHLANMDMQAFLEQRVAAVGLDDVNEVMPDGMPPPPPDDLVDRFWLWMDHDGVLSSLRDNLHHLRTFWEVRDRPNIVMLHYAELKADLDGQMRKLAERLGVAIDESRWPQLVEAATFEHMKAHADEVAPNATKPIWVDTASFFHKGTSGQWRDVIDEDGCERYATRIAELADPEFSAWIHQGQLTA